MILKASQRSGAKQLALHLMNTEDNEHVTVHDLRGVISDDVVGAFKEMQAVAKATRCQKFLFSLSLNPPDNQQVSIKEFEEAIERIEQELNLNQQPRAIIFHEKQGRRHAHCVYSRIDGENMKAIKLPFYKQRLNGIAKELYLDYGWDLPKGFVSKKLTNPLNFTLAEWQQSKRTGVDPREIKQALQQCWKISDSKPALRHALSENGFFLAKGDRRGFVAMDWRGEIYSLSRSLNIKAKEVKARLGEPSDLPTVEETEIMIADQYEQLHKRFSKTLRAKHDFAIKPLTDQKQVLRAEQRSMREQMTLAQTTRAQQEQAERQSKIRKGLLGLWDYLTGKSKKQHKENEQLAQQAIARDEREKEKLIQFQLEQRKRLQNQLQVLREAQQQEQAQLSEDMKQDLTPELRQKIRFSKSDDKPTLNI
ncbi:relaxase [Pseudoalteromonas sp. JC28]|uniref:relaxase/mobilization nuclease domain-containing protein n=1 Tax=Pseudoalteromonas sp. JC28 TaxID=2267617 RepID=UPI001574E1F7|nr:relaxase [Pseudoalteromonas sp. JC28]NSY32276.1 relaxase [Pseudoalteromonas sp. JC28]